MHLTPHWGKFSHCPHCGYSSRNQSSLGKRYWLCSRRAEGRQQNSWNWWGRGTAIDTNLTEPVYWILHFFMAAQVSFPITLLSLAESTSIFVCTPPSEIEIRFQYLADVSLTLLSLFWLIWLFQGYWTDRKQIILLYYKHYVYPHSSNRVDLWYSFFSHFLNTL